MPSWKILLELEEDDDARANKRKTDLNKLRARRKAIDIVDTETGKKAVVGEFEAHDEVEANDLFESIRSSVTKGRVTIHLCPHGDDPSTWYPCDDVSKSRLREHKK